MRPQAAIQSSVEGPVERPAAFAVFGFAAKRAVLAHTALLVFVWVLAIYQFSETTVDPDLWGHVVFGQHMLKARAVERVENYSWTVHGQPFINHEYCADFILGAAHSLFGGSGPLLLNVAIGRRAFGLSLRV